jgi:hypothetical protein
MKQVDAVDEIVELTGMPISSPIGFMAALGLLRVCAQDCGRDVRLSWSPSHARLHGLAACSLVQLLAEHMLGRSKAPEFNFEVCDEKGKRGPVMHLRKIAPADYRAAVAAFRGNDRALGFLAGFATDAVVNKEGFVARSKLDFSSGQQKLASEFRALAAALDPGRRSAQVSLATRIARALFGGPYEKQHTFGWDPASLMAHAHLAAAPTNSATPGQPMAVWLGVEALPLHPVVAVGPRRARTVGFHGTQAYVWPQWAEPLTLVEVARLRQRPVESLEQLPGVMAVWASAVTSVGKYGFLRPATRTRSVAIAPKGFAPAEVAE